MRILHLVSYSLYSGPLPPTVGLALAQRQAGHETWLAYDTKRGAFNPHEEPAAPRLQGLNLDPPLPLTMSAKSTLAEIWRDRAGLRRLAVDGLIDVVHVHLSHDHLVAALALPRGAKTICVRTVHSDRSLRRRLGQEHLYNRTHGFIVRTAAHEELLTQRFPNTRHCVATIPSGFDTTAWVRPSALECQQARERFSLPTAAFVVTQVALITDRGQRELVSAASMMPAAERPWLLFVGSGQGLPALRQHVSALGLEPWVRFAGYLSGDAELRQAYATADAAFLAQPGNDASARAGLEAMAAGVPLLTVATASLAAMVADERGYSVSSRDPQAIAAALATMMKDSAARASRAQRARTYVQQQRSFDQEATATLEVYRRAQYGRQS